MYHGCVESLEQYLVFAFGAIVVECVAFGHVVIVIVAVVVGADDERYLIEITLGFFFFFSVDNHALEFFFFVYNIEVVHLDLGLARGLVALGRHYCRHGYKCQSSNDFYYIFHLVSVLMQVV